MTFSANNHSWSKNKMAVYKLKFFDFMGVAEPIRYLLAYGGVQYENVIVNRGADWANVQKVVPFGKLPVFEVNNKVLYQSVAISRYLGKQFGLIPVDDFEAAELDAIAATVYDFGAKTHEWFHESDVQRKAVVEVELLEEVLPQYLKDFEEILKKKGFYFGGKQVSWADIYFVGIIESVQGMVKKDFLSQYPALQQLFVRVRSLPAIKTYISKRPDYKY